MQRGFEFERVYGFREVGGWPAGGYESQRFVDLLPE